jgi:hypothetical protein
VEKEPWRNLHQYRKYVFLCVLIKRISVFSKVSTKSIQQTPAKPDGAGRSGHYIKKQTKDQKKLTPSTTISNEAIPMNEQEHNEMLKVAKVNFY